MFERTLLTAGAALLAAAPAFAGGFEPAVVVAAPAAPVVVAPAAPVSTGGDWTGFYVGGQLGFGTLNIDDGDDATDDEDYDGSLYGLHAGYMRDFGRIVVGAELDFDGTQITVEDDSDATDDAVDVGSVARAKLRVGYDAGRFLPYLTAGVAQVRLNADNAAIDDLLDDSYNGQFIGVGAAYQLNDRFMVGAEVLRHQFDDTPFEDLETDVTTVSLRGSIRF
jgi:opacity protein-like surface antigen